MNKREIEYINNDIHIQVEIKKIVRNSFHYHSSIEILYILEGSLEVNKVDHKYILTKGDLYIINSGDIHKLYGNKEDNITLIAHIKPDYIKKLHGGLYDEIFRCRYIKSIKDIDYLCNTSYLEDKRKYVNNVKVNLLKIYILIELYNKEFKSSQKEKYKLRIKEYYIEVINLLLREFDIRDFYTRVSNLDEEMLDRTYQFIRYLNENYKEKITLDVLSKKLNLSKYYISHILNRYIPGGLSICVNNIRIYKGKYMLLLTDKNINDISEMCGFNNTGTFIKYFKEFFCITPSEFRKKYKGNEEKAIYGVIDKEKKSDLIKKNMGDYNEFIEECKEKNILYIDINKKFNVKSMIKVSIYIKSENHIEDVHKLVCIDNLYTLSSKNCKFVDEIYILNENLYSKYRKLLKAIKEECEFIEMVHINQLVYESNMGSNLYFYYSFINILEEYVLESNDEYLITKNKNEKYSILIFPNRICNKDALLQVKLNKKFLGRKVIEHRLKINNSSYKKFKSNKEKEILRRMSIPRCSLKIIEEEVYKTKIEEEVLILLEII